MKESIIYLEILKYIRQHGIEGFSKLIKTTIDISRYNKIYLIPEIIELVYRKLEVTNIDVVRFINSLDLSTRQRGFFLDEPFGGFIYQVGQHLDQIDLYVENAQKLVDLGIDKIEIINLSNQFGYRVHGHITYDKINNVSSYVNEDNEFIYFKDGNIAFCDHFYTDGEIYTKMVSGFTGKGTLQSPYTTERIDRTELYEIIVKKATFLIKVENTDKVQNKKRIAITDFGFDASKLPESIEELFEPQYVLSYKTKQKLRI